MRKRIGIGAILLTIVTTACGSADVALEGEHDPTAVPAEVSQLIDDWWAALERGDDSVLDLYLRSGYHLYGDLRFERDEIVGHLTGRPQYSNEWTTAPYAMANEGDGTYLVVRGIRITQASINTSWASAFAFEIETIEDGSLKIAHTAFIYRRD
jgi:hypothetical protein